MGAGRPAKHMHKNQPPSDATIPPRPHGNDCTPGPALFLPCAPVPRHTPGWLNLLGQFASLASTHYFMAYIISTIALLATGTATPPADVSNRPHARRQ